MFKFCAIIFLLLNVYGSDGSSDCSLCKCDELDIRNVPVLIDCQKVDTKVLFENWNFLKKFENESGMIYDIELGYNDIETLEYFPKSPVQKISFKMNKIRDIKIGVFANLTYLSYLDLSYNMITQGTFGVDIFSPGAGKKSLPLLNLNLAYNKITAIPKTAFDSLQNLDKLNLEGNPLQVLDHPIQTAITSLINLQTLSLASTQLNELPRNFLKGIPTLLKLDLSNNNFDVVPEETENGNQLLELTLDGNPIVLFSRNSFIGLNSLETLSANKMPRLIKIEDGAFSPLQNLTTLLLNDNKLNRFIDPDAFEGLISERFKLKNFHMRNNSLLYLPQNLLPEKSMWNQIEIIDIRYNPWVCDCHNEWMLTDLLKHIQDATPNLAANLTCGKPESFAGVPFANVNFTAMPCNPNDNFNPYKMTFGLASEHEQHHEDQNSSLTQIAIGVGIVCMITITVSSLIFTIVYVKRKNLQRYRSMHDVFYQVNSGMTFGNSVYRDNPTTIPVTIREEY